MLSSKIRTVGAFRQRVLLNLSLPGCISIRCLKYCSSVSKTSDENSDSENDKNISKDKNIEPHLSVITDNKSDSPPSLKTVSVIPGKGPPPEPPVTCCMTGCANCVWIMYAEELKAYYGDGGEQARKALDHIEDPSLKAFVKLELGIK